MSDGRDGSLYIGLIDNCPGVRRRAIDLWIGERSRHAIAAETRRSAGRRLRREHDLRAFEQVRVSEDVMLYPGGFWMLRPRRLTIAAPRPMGEPEVR